MGVQASTMVPSVTAELPLGQPPRVPDMQRRVGVKITYPAVPFSNRWVVDEMLLVMDSSNVTEVSEELIKAKMSETVPSSRLEIFKDLSTVTKPPTGMSHGERPVQTMPALIVNGEGPGRV